MVVMFGMYATASLIVFLFCFCCVSIFRALFFQFCLFVLHFIKSKNLQLHPQPLQMSEIIKLDLKKLIYKNFVEAFTLEKWHL